MTEIFRRFEEDSIYSDELSERYHDLGYWGGLSCTDYLDRNAERYGNKTAVMDDDDRLTWRELREEALSIAAGLKQHGIEKGDIIAYQIPSQLEWFTVRFGMAYAGAVALSLSPRFRHHELEHILGQAQPEAYIGLLSFGSYDHKETIRGIAADEPWLNEIVTLNDHDEPNLIALDNLKESHDSFSPDRIDPDYPEVISTTSGTTGKPKLYYLQQNSRLCLLRHQCERFGITGYDDLLLLAPVTQGLGEAHAYYLSLLTGSTIILTQVRDPVDQWQKIQDLEPSVVVAVPTQLVKMMNAHDMDTDSLESVRQIISGGADPPKEVFEYFEDLGPTFLNVYGASEAGGAAVTVGGDSPGVRYNSTGKLLNMTDVTVVDEDGNELPNGEVGEILWRGGSMCIGYYENAELTAEVTDEGGPWEGWFHSNDLGRLDDTGDLYVLGRKDNMIIRGGQNIYPSEVEEELLDHNDIEEVAIVPKPDPEFGERVCAYIVTSGATLAVEDLAEYLDTSGLAKYKWPEHVEVVDDLPKTSSGKIRRTDLEDDIRQLVSGE